MDCRYGARPSYTPEQQNARNIGERVGAAYDYYDKSAQDILGGIKDPELRLHAIEAAAEATDTPQKYFGYKLWHAREFHSNSPCIGRLRELACTAQQAMENAVTTERNVAAMFEDHLKGNPVINYRERFAVLEGLANGNSNPIKKAQLQLDIAEEKMKLYNNCESASGLVGALLGAEKNGILSADTRRARVEKLAEDPELKDIVYRTMIEETAESKDKNGLVLHAEYYYKRSSACFAADQDHINTRNYVTSAYEAVRQGVITPQAREAVIKEALAKVPQYAEQVRTIQLDYTPRWRVFKCRALKHSLATIHLRQAQAEVVAAQARKQAEVAATEALKQAELAALPTLVAQLNAQASQLAAEKAQKEGLALTMGVKLRHGLVVRIG